MELFTLGIDLAKTTFHLVGMNQRGEVLVRKRLSRTQLLHFTANLKVELIGMEACGGSHFLGRALREQGHEVRIIPAQYVKTNKNDYIDAEAIAEAVGRPTMRFVPIKSDEQLDLQSVHPSARALGDAPDRRREPDSRTIAGARHHAAQGPAICGHSAARDSCGCHIEAIGLTACTEDCGFSSIETA